MAKKKILIYAGVVIVLVLAFAVRYKGITFGFPLIVHPDEPEVVRPALNIMRTGDLNPHTFLYPSLYIYMQSAVYVMVFFIGFLLGAFRTLADIEPTAFYYWGRMLTIILSVGTICVTYAVGKYLFNRAVGLLATIFVAASYLHITNSFTITTDSPMAFWGSLAFFASVYNYLYGPRLKLYILNGICIGLAAGTKYTGIWCALPMVYVHLYHCGFSVKKLLDRKFLIGLACIPLAFVASTPYLLLDFKKFLYFIRYQKDAYTLGHPGAESAAVSFRFYWNAIVKKFGMPPLILGSIGSIFMLIKDRKKVLLLICFPVAYYLFFGSYKVRFDRNMVCMVPFLAILAGYGACALVESISGLSRKEKARNYIRAVLVIFLIFFLGKGALGQTRMALKRIRKITLPDTRWISKVWIEENLPLGSKIGREHYTPPVSPAKFEVVYLGYFGLLKGGIEKYDYVIASNTDYARFVNNPKRYPAEARRYNEIFSKYELIKEFVPDKKNTSGPVIRVFKVRR
ncbi:ArnT family glycosyltransferase [Candidatus Omnitrophota bacterium]